MIYKKNFFIPVKIKLAKPIKGYIYTTTERVGNLYLPNDLRVIKSRIKNKKLQNIHYEYINKVTKKIFKNLVNDLNNLLCLRRSERYWKIIIYPWLMNFVHGVYLKYLDLESIREKKIIFLLNNENIDINQYLINRSNYLYDDDKYHYILYYLLSKYFKNVKYEYSNFTFSRFYKNKNKNENFFQKLDFLISKIQNFFFKKLPMVHNSFLSRKKLILFSIKNNFFKFDDTYDLCKKKEIKSRLNNYLRKKLFKKVTFKDRFENIIFDIIKISLPSIFLEGFHKNLKNSIKNILTVSKPKFILTGTSYMSDIYFQLMTAELTRLNVPFYISQHGGQFDILKLLPERDFINEVADKFLIMGNKKFYSKKFKDKLIYQGYPKKISKINKIKNDSIILTVTTRFVNQYRLQSQMLAPQYDEYMNSIYAFLEQLDDLTRSNIIIKHIGLEFDEFYQKKIKKLDSNIKIIGEGSTFDLLTNCSLHIGTFVSTIEFESIIMGIPTIIINFDKYQNFTSQGNKFLKKLKDLKVYYEGLPKNLSKKKCLFKQIKKRKFTSTPDIINTVSQSMNKNFKPATF